MERELYFDITEKEHHLNSEQKSNLLNTFVDLHPYLESCYLLHSYDSETELINIYIVFQFDSNKHLDLAKLSEETKNRWKLNDLQDLFDKQKDEIWKYGCILYKGVPPLKRLLPDDIKQKLNLI